MAQFVLDASAVLRFLDKEAGWQRVAVILKDRLAGRAEIAISAVQWGEIAGTVRKNQGAAAQEKVMFLLSQFQPRVETATAQRCMLAAGLKVDRKISYADAFALELAISLPGCILVTADYGFKSVTDLAQIEFLPLK